MAALTGHVIRKHPRLRGYARHMATEAVGRACEAWPGDPGKAGRKVLPYLMRVVSNPANDADGIPSRPADEGVMKDLERHILARPARAARASDLPLSFGTMAPRSPVDPMEEVVRTAIARMKPTQRKTVAQIQSDGMDDEAHRRAHAAPGDSHLELHLSVSLLDTPTPALTTRHGY
ncbi:hypothetical protein [Streptomyces sp. NPDC002209]|uniref:hypothetical protein n=1 Tax=Streptomyces sp. NPDC002209 TaxID=3364638 RepID=UPI0036BBE8DC